MKAWSSDSGDILGGGGNLRREDLAGGSRACP
jgi:hypothetical protein